MIKEKNSENLQNKNILKTNLLALKIFIQFFFNIAQNET